MIAILFFQFCKGLCKTFILGLCFTTSVYVLLCYCGLYFVKILTFVIFWIKRVSSIYYALITN